MTVTKERLAQLLALARERKLTNTPVLAASAIAETSSTYTEVESSYLTHSIGMHGEAIIYNTKQQEAVTLGASGKSFVLLGAAGTGKSTSQRGVVQALIAANRAGILEDAGHKYLPGGTPGIVVCAYTRRAINNIRKVMPEDMKDNCITLHKLLEYQPVYYEAWDEALQKDVKTMRFEATRNRMNPLPTSIHAIIFEEASMIFTELFDEIVDALSHDVQFIFIGDIQQLPPVFGSSVLGYKMLELPVVELTEVYRQALESPIIRLAHRILSGNPIPLEELSQWEFPGKLKLHPWKKKLSVDIGILTIAKFFSQAIDTGAYDYQEDMILCPFNKSFGTDELNKYIAQHITAKNGASVHEIVAGFEKHYYAIGDRCMYEKEDAVIINIAMNGLYVGAKYSEASPLLDRWGNYRSAKDVSVEQQAKSGTHQPTEDDIDAMLNNMSFVGSDSEDRKREASHVITLTLADSGEEVSISAAGAVNNLSLGYAMTVHKAQGSEARKVFLVIHQSHATMIQRELLYTAVTRARESLYVICEPDTFVKGIERQKIKGNTLAEKAEFFKGKIKAGALQTKLV
jgi:ATP-dependent exoDNAse (exonuclease V) alpha subunit